MLKRLTLTATLVLLTGCAGYEYGDVTSRVLQAQAEYCASADPYQRAVRMVLLRWAGLDVPKGGACANILEVIDAGVSE